LAVLHDEANSLQLACVGKRISSLCRECSAPSLLSCECVATNPAVMKRLKTTKPTAGKAVQVLV